MRYLCLIDITRNRGKGSFVVNGWVEAQSEALAVAAAVMARKRNARVKVVRWEDATEDARRVAMERGEIKP